MFIEKRKIATPEDEKPCPVCGWPIQPGDEIFILENTETGILMCSPICCKPCVDAFLEG